MVMVLPFVVGLVAAVLAARGRRNAALWAWSVLIPVLLAWFKYHATDSLSLAF